MKHVIIFLTLFLSINASAQEEQGTSKKLFVRVFNTDGKKIGKGYIHSVNDSILVLRRKETLKEYRYQEIGSIKTKRSTGHNTLIGASIGATTTILVGAGVGGENPFEGYAGIGTLVFSGVGGGIGALTSVFKNSQTFIINGNPENWETFRDLLKNDSD